MHGPSHEKNYLLNVNQINSRYWYFIQLQDHHYSFCYSSAVSKINKPNKQKEESRNKKAGENEEKAEWEAKMEERLLNLPDSCSSSHSLYSKELSYKHGFEQLWYKS